MRFAWFLVVTAIMTATAACSYPALDRTNPPTDAHPSDGKLPSDGKPPPNDGHLPFMDAPQSGCLAQPAYTAAPTAQQSQYETHSDVIDYVANLSTSSPPDQLWFTLWDSGTVWPGGFDAPITIDLAEQASSPQGACDVCVGIDIKCQGCTIDNDNGAADMYWAMSGSLHITRIDTVLQGTLTNATFARATANNGKFHFVGDSCRSTIASLSFSASVPNVNE
jgi:hypothetical protein